MARRIDGEEALVHTEFQTTDSTDTPMPIRMAGYIIRIIEQYGLIEWLGVRAKHHHEYHFSGGSYGRDYA